MSFENSLADCLALLDAGATEEECLALHPDHAEQLAPFLWIATRLRNQPTPRLNSQAFARGRAAAQAEAARQQTLMASHRRPPTAPQSSLTQHQPGARHRRPLYRRQARLRPQSHLPRPFSSLHLMTSVLAIALVLMSSLTLIRSAGNSLPGDRIYGLKRLGEKTEGALMGVAGQSAAWHMQQAERRLHESLALEMRGQTPDPALTISISASVQAAINTSRDMPSADRAAFLASWLDNLRVLQIAFSTAQPFIPSSSGTGTSSAQPSLTTLSQTINTVKMAAEDQTDAHSLPSFTNTDDPLPPENGTESTQESINAGDMETLVVIPTLTSTLAPTLTPHPTATPTWTPHPTATPTWTVAPSSTARPTAAPTDAPTPTSGPSATVESAPNAATSSQG